MAKTKFTARLSTAVRSLQSGRGLAALKFRSGSLFTPVYRNSRYQWLKVMDSDGLIVAMRRVHSVNNEGAKPAGDTALRLGVIVQSEDSTAQTKPNPLGKASLKHMPYGVWVDLVDCGRVRLDRVLVVFVLPKGSAYERKHAFSVASRNVSNAALIMPDAVTVTVDRGASSETIAEAVLVEVRPFLAGRGRPRSES